MNVSGISAHSCWGRRSKGVPPPSRVPVGAPDHAAPLLSHNIENQQEAMPPFVGDGVLNVPNERKIIAHLQDDVTHLSIPRSRAAISGLTPPQPCPIVHLQNCCKRRKLFVGDDACIVPDGGPCHISHHIIRHKATGAQCAPLRSLHTKMPFTCIGGQVFCPRPSA